MKDAWDKVKIGKPRKLEIKGHCSYFMPKMWITFRLGFIVQHIRCPGCNLKVKGFGLDRTLKKWGKAIDKVPARF